MKRGLGWLALTLGWAGPAAAQPAASLTLEQVVRQASESYPSVRASLEQVSAAAAGIDLARSAYLPRADLLGQLNRATRNNVFGLLLPQPVISPISGPVLGRTSLANVWGTAAGLLVSWEPFDFGTRAAGVGAAQATRSRAGAQTAVTRLETGMAAADAYLTVLAAQQMVRAAQAGVERARVLDQSVQTLVKNELRPGADASRSAAELAAARTQQIQAQTAERVSRAALAQLAPSAAPPVRLEASGLLRRPAKLERAASEPAVHPRAAAQNAAIEEVRARQKILDRSWFPRLQVQGTTFARGSGANPDGSTGGSASGLGPNFYNWALGMTVSFPALDLPSLRARRQIEASNERAEAARYQQVLQELNGQLEKARATLDGARLVAENTPIQLVAARALVEQAGARYKAGLATIVEVAEAQRLLTQAEIDDALAELGVWRALLALSAAQGDLDPFLEQAR